MKNEEFDLLDDLSEHANSPKKTKYTPNSLAQKASSKHRTIKSCIHKNDKNRNINKNNLKLDLTFENSKHKNTLNSSRKEKKDDKYTKYTPDYRNKPKISQTYKSESKRKSVNNGKNSPSKKNILRNSYQIGKNFALTSKKRFDLTTPDIIQENTNNKPKQETKLSTKQHNLQNTLNIKNNKGASVDSRKIKNNQKLKLSIRESKKKEGELNLSHSIKKERKDDDNISKKSFIKEKKHIFHEKKESELISKKSTIKDKKESELISKKSTIRSKKESELISKKSTLKDKKESELISKKSTLKEKKEDKKTNKSNTLKEIKEEKHYKKITSKEIKEEERQYKASTSRGKKDEKKNKKNNLKEKKYEEKTQKEKEEKNEKNHHVKEKKEKNVDINYKKSDQKEKSLDKNIKDPNMNKKDKDKDKNKIAKKMEEIKEIKIESKIKNLKNNEIKTNSQANSAIKKFNSNSSLSLSQKDNENLEDLEKEKSKKKPIKKIDLKQKNISNSSRETNNDNQNLTDINFENNNSSKNKKYISNMDNSCQRNNTTNYVNKKLNLKNKKEKSQMNMKSIKNDKNNNDEKKVKEKFDKNNDKNESNILIKNALITSDKIILEKSDNDNNTFNKLSNSNSKNQINSKNKKINSAQNLNQILKEKLSNKNINDKKDFKKSVRLSIVSEKSLFNPINLENIQAKNEEINNEEESKKQKSINDEQNKIIQMNQEKEKICKDEENHEKEKEKEEEKDKEKKEEKKEDIKEVKKEDKKEEKKEDKKEEKEKKKDKQQEKDQKSEKSIDISSDSNENSLSGKEEDSVLKKEDVQKILKELEKETKEAKESAIKEEVPQNNSADTVKQKKVVIKRKTIVIQKSCSSEIRDNSNKNSLNNKSIYNSINKGIRSKSEKAISEFSINEEKIVVDNFKSQASLSRAGKDETGNIKTNQDSYIVLTRVNNLKEYNIFGVLDGHGTEGHLVSQFVSQYIQREFQINPSLEKLKDIEKIYSTLSSNDFELIKNIFINADNSLKDQKIDSRASGTTCVLVIQVGEHIICANTGDSRAVLVFDEKNDENLNFIKVFPLSIDSKPEIPTEKERIIQSGGSVEKILNKYGQPTGPFRVWAKNKDYPGLAMSRSIGDFNGKSVGLIPDPEIIECNLSVYSKYIIICSDGVWEFLSNDDAMNIGKKYYLENNPRGFCKELIDNSVKFWEKEDVVIDDITVVTIFF